MAYEKDVLRQSARYRPENTERQDDDVQRGRFKSWKSEGRTGCRSRYAIKLRSVDTVPSRRCERREDARVQPRCAHPLIALPDERAYVLFGSEDKVRIGPKKRRRLDQLQSFQTGVTLLADDEVALDRNTELLRDLNNHSRHLDRQHAMVLGLLPDDCASARPDGMMSAWGDERQNSH